MIIRNFQTLSTNSAKKDALSIIEAGLGAANPKSYLEKIIQNNKLILPGKKLILENILMSLSSQWEKQPIRWHALWMY